MSTAKAPLRDRLIPWYFVAFFLVVILVDGVMATIAVRTRTGLVTDHAYERGLNYNQAIAAERGQEELGWKANITIREQTLHVTLTDATGAPVTPTTMRAHFYRPSTEKLDFEVTLKNGEAALSPPANGLWEVQVFATVGDKRFQQRKRIVL